jgi:MraZ protein
MTRFLGTHRNRLDKKGRVSVPAEFRAELERLGSAQIILRPSHRAACLECWPEPEFARLAAGLERFPAFSEEQEDLSASLFADAHPIRPDAEGRVVLPEELVAHAGLSEWVAFVGLGAIFQIWEPEAARRRIEEARARAKARGLTLSPGAAP